MEIRRVVSGNRDGKAVVLSDGIAPRGHEFRQTPQMAQSLIWATEPGDALEATEVDRTESIESVVPGPGGTRFFFVKFPPQSVFMSSDFDPGAAAAEHLEISPGLAERFEPDNPGKHTTPTLDYAVVIDGSLFIEFDEEEVELHQGDVVVQPATRHSWSVRTEETATIAVVMIGVAGSDA
jgi:mannose-6-phosphate isomerase-like protein (cupin superfamily)